MDVVNRCGAADNGDYLFVHQLDPKAIDIEKVRKYRKEGIEHQLQFPNQFVDNYVQVPMEVAIFKRVLFESKLGNLRGNEKAPNYDDYSARCWEQHPARFVMINTKWDMAEMHRHVMDIYTKILRK